jgi:hypothetical protein
MLAVLASCKGQQYDVDVGAMFAQVSGDISLQNSSGTLTGNYQNDLDTNFGVGDTEASPYLRVQTDYGRHRFRADGFAIDAEGSGTLSNPFGDLPAGSPVTTSMDLWSVGANWSFELVRQERFRLGIGLALDYFAMDLTARTTLGRESLDTSVLVPMPCAEVEGYFGPVTLGANAGLMSADLGDGNGRYIDAETYVKVRPHSRFDLLLGYRYVLLDGYGRASGRDFDAEIDMQAIFIGGGIRL